MSIQSIVPPQVAPTAVEVEAYPGGATSDVLTPAALHFLGRLSARFESTRQALLARRRDRQQRLDASELPDFLPETRELREAPWTVAPIPHDLSRRHVEITG